MSKNGENLIFSTDLIHKNRRCTEEVGESSSDFYYFTTVDSLEKILNCDGENYILVSPISKMNDLHERELHIKDGDSAYGLCFCNSDMDNIPMWYLYGGISGKGARMKITSRKMKDLISDIEFVYAVNNFKLGEKLYRYRDFDLEFGWIFYRENEEVIRYRDAYYRLIDSIDSFEKDNFFIKDIEWKYEKEFRILFRIHSPKKLPERIALPLNKAKLMQNGGGLSVMLAPELKPRGDEAGEREKYSEKFDIPVSKVSFSKLRIRMNLLERNRYTIINQFSDVIQGMKKEEVSNICKQMQQDELCAKSIRQKVAGKKRKEPANV